MVEAGHGVHGSAYYSLYSCVFAIFLNKLDTHILSLYLPNHHTRYLFPQDPNHTHLQIATMAPSSIVTVPCVLGTRDTNNS